MTLYARLAASLLALAAGAAGIVVAAELLRSVPGPTPPTTAGVAGPPAPASIAGGRIATPNEPGFPSPPPGAVVLSRQAGSFALGLALQPRLVRASVLSPEGAGQAGLDVRISLGGRAVRAAPCGSGCYQARLAVGDARAIEVTLDGRLYGFALPKLPAADAGEVATKAAKVWLGLMTLVWHERLAGSPTDVIHTVYRAVAPDELEYTIAGGSAAVIIGGTRWDSPAPSAPWHRSEQNPPIRQPAPFWDSSLDAHVLGTGRFGGRPAWRVSFFDPATPAWFTVWIDRGSYRTLELDMIAASHFMHHVYGPFDAPLQLEPPVS